METWFEIFKTGTHTDAGGTTRTWTCDDLDAIAGQYNASAHEAPIVIGHPEQTAPAYGWVDELKREGEMLLAKVTQLMPEFAELVNAGRYKKVSIGLTADGLLHHVGFLGAMVPAVAGLADAEFSGSYSATEIDFTAQPAQTTGTREEAAESVIEQPLLLGALTRFAERLEAIESYIAAHQRQRTTEAAVTGATEAAELQGTLQQAVHAGKITPAQKTLALELFSAMQGNSTAADGETKCISQLFKQFIDLQQGHSLFSELPRPVLHPEMQPVSEFEKVRGVIQRSMQTKQ